LEGITKMKRSEIERFFSDDEDYASSGNTQLMAGDDTSSWLNDSESDGDGQLSIDMYQTDTDLVIKAPVAGVNPDDLEISVTDDFFTIKGKRHEEHKHESNDFFIKECYWGSFSRTQSLPVSVIAEKAEASISKKGILTVRVPKAVRSKSKSLKINVE